jgi:hypothetical protein
LGAVEGAETSADEIRRLNKKVPLRVIAEGDFHRGDFGSEISASFKSTPLSANTEINLVFASGRA